MIAHSSAEANVGSLLIWDEPWRHVDPLNELVNRIGRAGHQAEHRWLDGWWLLIVDGEQVARGYSQGEMLEAGERWWRQSR